MDKRLTYLDYLRVVSFCAVVGIHVSAIHFNDLDARSYEWNVMNFYCALVRWANIVFVMISGTLFLSRNNDMHIIFRKNILKLVVSYFVWASLYAFLTPIISGEETDIYHIINRCIVGSYHMWYIPMIIGIYMCIPIFEAIVKSKKLSIYYLALSFLFVFLIPYINIIVTTFLGEPFSLVMNAINNVISDMNMNIVLGYGFCFVLGHVINTTSFSTKYRRLIYCMGGVGLISTIILSSLGAWKTGEPYSKLLNNFSLGLMLVAIFIFCFFKNMTYHNEKCNKIISKLSTYSFGAYLVHVFIITVIKRTGPDTVSFNPIFAVPMVNIIVIAISYALSAVLNKIPFVKKWLV